MGGKPHGNCAGGAIAGLGQQLALPKEDLPQLAAHAEGQMPVLAFDEAGLDALHEALGVQPATGGAQAAVAGKGDDSGFAAGMPAQTDETCGGCPAGAHPLQRATGRLPDIHRDAPGQGREGLVAVVLQDLLQHPGMGVHT